MEDQGEDPAAKHVEEFVVYLEVAPVARDVDAGSEVGPVLEFESAAAGSVDVAAAAAVVVSVAVGIPAGVVVSC